MAFIPSRQYHNYWSMIKISICLLVSHCFLAPKPIESSCLVLVSSMATVGSLTGPVSPGSLCQLWVDQRFCDPCRRCWCGEGRLGEHCLGPCRTDEHGQRGGLLRAWTWWWGPAKACPALVLMEVSGAEASEHPRIIRGRMAFGSSMTMENSWELLLKHSEE